MQQADGALIVSDSALANFKVSAVNGSRINALFWVFLKASQVTFLITHIIILHMSHVCRCYS